MYVLFHYLIIVKQRLSYTSDILMTGDGYLYVLELVVYFFRNWAHETIQDSMEYMV